MLKILGLLILLLIGLFLLLIIAIVLLLKFSPAFGGKHRASQLEKYSRSPHFQQGHFQNVTKLQLDHSLPDFSKSRLGSSKRRIPQQPLPYQKINPALLQNPSEEAVITWFGHSTFLIELAQKIIFVDPMLSNYPSPIQGLGRRRYSKEIPIQIDDLPTIDVVLLTHDHYDHLDYRSILGIKDKVKQFVVPLGMSSHLLRWGVPSANILELDWWEVYHFEDLSFTFTPTHHYSGRSLSDRRASLWGGWIIQSPKQSLFVSGDGGYGEHFKYIGEKYGPFDLAMIECGQYNRNWPHNHMFPEQAVLVAQEVGAKKSMPIHWGAFTLAFHDWDEPVKRFVALAETQQIDYITPMIGQRFTLSEQPQSKWWTAVE